MNTPEKAAAWDALTDLARGAKAIRISELCDGLCDEPCDEPCDKPCDELCDELCDKLCDELCRYGNYSLDLDGLHLDLSRHLITDEIKEALINLALASDVEGHRDRMFRGEKINTSEDRAVLHTALRSNNGNEEGSKKRAEDLAAMKNLCKAFHSKEGWLSATGKPVTDVINIGIGGSDLGPKMATQALRDLARPNLRCHFISNVDGAEIKHLLKQLDPETTAVIISSKTFTTTETLINAETALNWLAASIPQLAKNPANSPQVFAVTANPDAAKAFGVPAQQILRFDESIGGRYSIWSTIGFPLALSIGFDNFLELLAGAATMDEHFLTAPPAKNLPMQMALTGIWYNNFIGWRSQAVVPYCQRLNMLVDYLQQLDMESNGKSATRDNQAVAVDTAPVLWGQTGTNGQHAFFQMLHQGTEPVPVDFIGLVEDAGSDPRHHQVLKANMLAQAEALMRGRSSDSPHNHYPGNRPSTVILLDALTPRNLGMLLALYEHKVFVQGCIWNINSFDQWGVELGKELAGQILGGLFVNKKFVDEKSVNKKFVDEKSVNKESVDEKSDDGKPAQSEGFKALLKRAGLA